jgi:23S rRNA (uracil1939-C5)-methyltransferase
LHRAAIQEILTPSPDRREAPCPHFGPCGGCHYQHAAYPAQLRLKEEILREALSRIGKIAPPERIEVIAGPELHYRNRAQFHLDGRRIGFHSAGSHDLTPVDACAVVSPKLGEALAAMRRMLPGRRFPNFLRSLELFTNETEVQLNVLETGRPLARVFFDWCASEIPGFVPGALAYPAAGLNFRVSHGAFFQVNRFLVDALVEAALGDARGESALDLYAGVGLFTLPLARRFARVTAVESGNAPWRDLMHNAGAAELEVSALRTTADGFLRENPGKWDFVLADPPRAGLGKQVTSLLAECGAAKVTIVSCDPTTLARDLAALSHVYAIESMTMMDLFPQTFHIETVTRLRRTH